MDRTSTRGDAYTAFHTTLEPLLGDLYDGVTSPHGFQTFIGKLAPVFMLNAVNLVIHNRESHEVKKLWLHGITVDWVERYALEYSQEDMLAQHIMQSPVAHFYASNLDIARPEEIFDTRFYREWLAPQGVVYGAAAIVMHEGAWSTQIFLLRDAAAGGFSREEIDALDLLMPHLQRAIQMRMRFTELEMGQDFLAGGLDVLRIPTLFFDEHGRVMHMNKRAKAMLTGSRHLRIEDSHLIASDREASRKLSYEIGSAIQASRGGTAAFNEVVLLPRQDQLPLMLMLAPVRTHGGQRHGAALLFVFDPDNALNLTIEHVCKLFGLTKAEARIAVALCRGQTLEDFAREFSVSLNTVRTQLKSVFIKTGTRRQAELVSLLLASPACFLADREVPLS
jgi:DNA-binding CsgD family transcriptional regulator